MIPKKVHLSWKTKDIATHPSPIITVGVRQLIDLNPDWEVTIHDDKDVEDFLQKHLPIQDYELLTNRGIVEKSDVWRLLKMYLEGGVYVDVDRLCNTPLDDIAEEGVKCVLPTCGNFDFSQDFMMSESENPIYKLALDLNLQRRRQGHTSIYFLGAQTYMHAVSLLLTGVMTDTNPGEEIFLNIVKAIDRAPFLATYKEQPPYCTILFRDAITDFNHEHEKRRLYADFGMRHWSGEW